MPRDSAGLLMYRKTGQDAYRQETLAFVRAQERVWPYYGWLYGMEALLETKESRRNAAACRTQYLDARSYFLSQAKVRNLDAAKCRETLASLLH